MKPTIEQIDEAINDFENCGCNSEMILLALRVLKKLMDEPSEKMVEVWSMWNEGYFTGASDTTGFKAMRDQLLKEVV